MKNRPELMTRHAQGQDTNKVLTRLREIRERGILRREASVGAIDVEARTVELSFSSEIEYERWFGVEILDHSADAIRLDRMNDGAALLWMHNWDEQRGAVVSGTARVDSDRKGRCKVKFSRSEDGEELFQDVIDGIVTKVSVGYMVHGLKLQEERENIDVYRVTDWEPYEVSLVSVPADPTVGVGRSAEKPQEDQQAKQPQNSSIERKPSEPNRFNEANTTMNEKILRDGAGNLVRAKVDLDGKIVEVLEILEKAGADVQASAQRGADGERARVRAITDLGKTYGRTDLALQYVSEGKTPEDFQRALLHDFAAEKSAKPLGDQVNDANIGMSDKEVRQFSMFKVIRAISDPTDSALQKAAAFEFECSRAAAERYGKTPKGIIIPNDVLASRDFSTVAPTGGPGAALVATNHLAGSFIELLRKKTWVMRRARTLAGLVGNVEIPRQNAASSAYWVGEGGAPTPGQPGVDQVMFTPKTVGAYTDITRRLVMQSTPDAESLVRDDILKIIALEIDRTAIYGTGTEHQPKGVKNYTGINGVDFAAAGQPTFAELVAMETAIALDDADVDSMSYAFNAAIRGHMKTSPKFGTGTEATIWEQGNTVNGYQTNVSNQVATGDVFFANWQDLVVAMWGGLELRIDPYSLSTSGGLRLVALQDVDFNLRHVESFCYGSNTVA